MKRILILVAIMIVLGIAWLASLHLPICKKPANKNTHTIENSLRVVSGQDHAGQFQGRFRTTYVIAWDRKLDTPVITYPVIGSDGLVRVAGSTGIVYAITEKGSIRWQTSIHGVVASSPTIDKDNDIWLFSVFPTDLLIRISSTGKELSRTNLSHRITGESTHVGSLLIYNAGDGYLHAFDTQALAERWSYPLAFDPSLSKITATGTTVVVADYRRLVVLDVDGRVYQVRRLVTPQPSTIILSDDDEHFYLSDETGIIVGRLSTRTYKKISSSGRGITNLSICEDGTIVASRGGMNQIAALAPNGDLLWAMNSKGPIAGDRVVVDRHSNVAWVTTEGKFVTSDSSGKTIQELNISLSPKEHIMAPPQFGDDGEVYLTITLPKKATRIVKLQ